MLFVPVEFPHIRGLACGCKPRIRFSAEGWWIEHQYVGYVRAWAANGQAPS